VICFKSQRSFNALKRQLPRARIERLKGSVKQAKVYLAKDNKILVEQGEAPHQGTPFADVVSAVREGKSFTEIAEEFPEEAIRYHAGIRALSDAYRFRDAPSVETHHLYPWQQWIIDCIMLPVHPRWIYWIVDLYGNSGKSWLCCYLQDHFHAQLFENSKTADVAHAYRTSTPEGFQPIACFDFTCAQEEQINYAVIENIKNGKIFSGKYDSVGKRFRVPHVICFSNFEPDQRKMMPDRWARIVRLPRNSHPLSAIHDSVAPPPPFLQDQEHLAAPEFVGTGRPTHAFMEREDWSEDWGNCDTAPRECAETLPLDDADICELPPVDISEPPMKKPRTLRQAMESQPSQPQ